MPRKFFRKFLPSHATIRENRYVARLGRWIHHHNLWHLHRRSVAGGVAAGLFAGLIPGSNPVQFVAATLLSVAFRVNLPIAVVVTLYSNPFTIVPLYYIAFKLGQLVLMEGDGSLPSVALDLHDKTMAEWLPAAFEWLTSIGKPLLVGIPLFALLLSVTGYICVRWGWRCYMVYAWRARQRRRASAGAAKP